MTSYLIQAIGFQALFLLAYYVFFKKETFFTLNRAYLLLTPMIGLILPLLSIDSFQETETAKTMITYLPELFIGSTSNEGPETEGVVGSSWIIVIYTAGLLLSSVWFFLKLRALSSHFKHGGKDKIIVLPNSTEAFSFFNYVFIGAAIDTLSRKRIIAHEMTHVKQGHTWDLLFYELLRIVMWFNPLVFLYQREIAVVHEYLADENAIQSTSKKDYYQDVLNATFETHYFSCINTFFNHSFIKKRIIMLQKSKSKRIAQLKYLLTVPLVLVMVVMVACSQEPITEESKSVSIEEQVADLQLILEEKKNLTTEELSSIEQLNSKAQQLVAVIEVVESEDQALANQEMQENEIPFAVIDKAPTFLECQSLGDKDQKKCTSDRISSIVQSNLDIKAAEAASTSALSRAFVRFKINKKGQVVDISARASNKVLEELAIAAVAKIPQMIPGEQKGKKVAVLYSLPIVLKFDTKE